MSTQNTTTTEPNKDTGGAESVKTQSDTPKKDGADQAPEVTKDDFLSKPAPAPVDNSAQKAEAAKRKEGIIKDIFIKYVDTNEDGTANLDKIPKDMEWTKGEIKQRYFQAPEAPAPANNPIDNLDSAFDKKFAEKQFEAEIDAIVADPNLTKVQKAEIKAQFSQIKSDGMSDDLKALKLAKQLVTSQQKQIVGTMPDVGNAPDLTKQQYSMEELSKMSKSDYNKIMDMKEQGEVTIVA